MKHFFTFSLIFFWTPALYAAWWSDGDYSFGSNGFHKESLSVYHNVSTNVTIGMNVMSYKDDVIYKNASFSFRMPFSYSSRKFIISVKPFYYPNLSGIRSKAYGAKFYYFTSLFESEEPKEDSSNLIFSASGARQETIVASNSGLKDKKWTEVSLEMQVEKNFFNEFFFFISAALFRSFNNIKPSDLINPVLEHSEMAFLGTVNKVTDIPESSLNFQFARNMGPDFNSHLYIGFSKISFRELKDIHSAILGMRIKVSDNLFADTVYNWFKPNGSGNKNYYKFFLQLFF